MLDCDGHFFASQSVFRFTGDLDPPLHPFFEKDNIFCFLETLSGDSGVDLCFNADAPDALSVPMLATTM